FTRFKQDHPDCLLLFRMGDFYELFGPDAATAHRVLGITLTERTKGMPMAGVPHHSAETYLRRLVDQGHRVAVCDQVQDPKDAKGVVDRAVTRVLTPGTLVDESLLEEGRENLVAAVAPFVDDRVGVAVAELSTGSFTICECRPDELADVLARFGPNELLCPESQDLPEAIRLPDDLAEAVDAAETRRAAWMFGAEEGDRTLREHYRVADLEAFGLIPDEPVTAAAGALLRYLLETQAADREPSDDRPRPLAHLRPPRRRDDDRRMQLDQATLSSLEIERTSRRGEVEGSLLSVFPHCRTAMGRRALRRRLCWPLTDLDDIRGRHRTVGGLVEDRTAAEAIRQALNGMNDVARIAGRVAVGRATPRDVVALGRSVEAARPLVDLLERRPAFADVRDRLEAAIAGLDDLARRIHATCVDEPPAHLRDGGLVRDGVDEALDEARTLERDATSWLVGYQAKIVEETGIGSLKVGFNKVFGYYIEVSKANDARIPPHFVRKQTLKNAERYITDELKVFEDKVLTAGARALERERIVFADLCLSIAGHLEGIAAFGDVVADLDGTQCLAETAHRLGWIQPEMDDSDVLELVEARHPVLDATMRDRFVPNDTGLATRDQPATLALITGPNMAGKSTYIRQTALVVLLAQAGSFVPATSARIGIADRILTRIGAADELHAGRSTFMVEMTETANILHHATDRSLVVLDEIGRGTSTLDGLSLAWALAEALAARGSRTLFATHYHELTSIADRMPEVANLHVTVREWQDRIVFLHRIQPGRTDRSYGIHVAELAGLAPDVVARARELLATLAVHEGDAAARAATIPSAPDPSPDPQMSLFREFLPHPALDRLRAVDLDALTPLAAFDLLRDLVQEVSPPDDD
ncbi:MAG: DNA mismatch repair protein MutS, partial [Planctomycetota bacterium]|nr:DNA mismatch repair protein MutS [Planctomycetota bacterium]